MYIHITQNLLRQTKLIVCIVLVNSFIIMKGSKIYIINYVIEALHACLNDKMNKLDFQIIKISYDF